MIFGCFAIQPESDRFLGPRERIKKAKREQYLLKGAQGLRESARVVCAEIIIAPRRFIHGFMFSGRCIPTGKPRVFFQVLRFRSVLVGPTGSDTGNYDWVRKANQKQQEA